MQESKREKHSRGEVNLMQIYGENNADEHSVEMMFSYEELKELVIALSEFEHQIAQYKKDNSGKADLGFTHLHFKDCGEIGKKSKNDVVFYVNLSER